MNCKTAVGMLSAYLDRELAPQERDAVRLHLADCDACRTEERDLRALKGLLLGVRAPEPAPDFERRLMNGLRQEAALPTRRLVLPRLRPLVWGQIGGLAAAATLAFVVMHTPRATDIRNVEPRVGEVVAQNVDYDVDAQRFDAYSQGADYSAGPSLLMPTNYGP